MNTALNLKVLYDKNFGGENMRFLITGDTHRIFSRFHSIKPVENEQTAVIILGDAGLNIGRERDDRDTKNALCRNYPYLFYCVRGNHELRPEDVPGMELIWDDYVGGHVWVENSFPNIRYFQDWGIYHINGLRTLVIGGAYSVDKWWRLQRGSFWSSREQLTTEEMEECERFVTKRPHFDLVLSHTTATRYQPTDLFLGCIDQTTVDNTMEKWLEHLFEKITFGIHLFGHYHADRIEAPYVEQFFNEIEDLNAIVNRWYQYSQTEQLDWWLPRSPKMDRIEQQRG